MILRLVDEKTTFSIYLSLLNDLSAFFQPLFFAAAIELTGAVVPRHPRVRRPRMDFWSEARKNALQFLAEVVVEPSLNKQMRIDTELLPLFFLISLKVQRKVDAAPRQFENQTNQMATCVGKGHWRSLPNVIRMKAMCISGNSP